MNKNYDKVRGILDRISCTVGGHPTHLHLDFDKKYSNPHGESRMYIQVHYQAKCVKTGGLQWWKGRKLYLSDHMIPNEVIFTAFLAVELAERHERMENFKVEGTILVNPHVDYRQLLKISTEENEVKRT